MGIVPKRFPHVNHSLLVCITIGIIMIEDIQKHSVHTLVFRSLKRTHDIFLSEEGTLPPLDPKAEAIWKASKARDAYGPIVDLVKKQQDLARKTGLPTNISDEVLVSDLYLKLGTRKRPKRVNMKLEAFFFVVAVGRPVNRGALVFL